MSGNPLSALAIDSWYKIIPVIGAVTLVLSLTVELKAVPNLVVLFASLGAIFIGIGEWINHPLQTKIGAGLKITSRNRVNTISGNVWVLGGIALIIFGIVRYGA